MDHSTTLQSTETENIAQTLARELPKPSLLNTVKVEHAEGLHVAFVALPKGADVRELRVDLEATLPHPRAIKAKALFAEAQSFLDYVARHANESSVAWCHFDPQTFALSFTAVLDDHVQDLPGWRRHTANFTPDMSAEWKAWKGHDKRPFDQVAFAEWIQEHDDDIATAAGGEEDEVTFEQADLHPAR